MSFTAKIDGLGTFNVNIGAAGPSGLLTAEAPLFYDSVLRNISIDLTAYATESWVDANYYSVTNPDGYVTSAALAGYATQSWVQSQGYLTAPYNPFDQTLNTTDTVAFDRVEIKSSNMAVARLYEMANPTNLGIEAIGGSGFANVQPYVKVKDFTSGNYLTVRGAGITFSDSTTQTTAGISAGDAASTYYPLTNPSGYITSSALSPYLLSSTAASTYQPIGDYATNTALTNGLALKLDKPAVAGVAGQILSTDGTNNLWIDNFARTLSCTVRNETGSTVTKGTIVYLSGASGNKPLIQKAIASSESGSSKTFGIVSADIQTSQNGEVVSVGQLVNVNTLGLTEGVSLWLSPTTAGAWTTTKPAAPNHAVFIGTVVRAHQTQGVVEVRIQNGFELSELHDVSIPSPSNNDVVVYESATSLYKGKSISTIIGGTPATQAWVGSQGYLTAPYNPFNQTLNTTDTVAFGGLSVYPQTSGGLIQFYFEDNNGLKVLNPQSGLYSLFSSNGITFPDNTVQTSAFNGVPYNGGTQFTGGLWATDSGANFPLSSIGGIWSFAYNTGFVVESNGTVSVINDNVGGSVTQIGWDEIRTDKLTVRHPAGLECVTITNIDGTNGSSVLVNDGNSSVLVTATSITFPDGTIQTTAFSGSGANPFDQSLNTTDSVRFANVDASRYIDILKVPDSGTFIPIVRVTQDQQTATISSGGLYAYDSSFSIGTSYWYNGITFPDSTTQTTAGISPATAASTYQTISGMSSYLTTVDAASTYLTQANASSTYQTQAGMSAYPTLAGTNGFTGANTFTTSSGGNVPLTIQNNGTGNSFVVNDQAADPTPFVINSAGLVGINVTTPAAMLDIAHSLTSGTGIRLAVASGQSFTSAAGLLYVNIANTGASGKGLVIENRGTGDCLYIHDQLATDTTPFVVDNDGNCIIGGQTITAGYKLDVRGNAKVDAIKIGGSSNLSAVNYTTTGQPATVDRTTYPNEIQVVINGVTYAMPARQV